MSFITPEANVAVLLGTAAPPSPKADYEADARAKSPAVIEGVARFADHLEASKVLAKVEATHKLETRQCKD